VYKKSLPWCIIFLISTLGYINANKSIFSLYNKLGISFVLYRINTQQTININTLIIESVHLVVIQIINLLY